MKLFIIAYCNIQKQEEGSMLRQTQHQLIKSFSFLSTCTPHATRPCQMIGPVFEKMASENPGITFVKVDVDDSEEIAAACGISAMPTFQFFTGGEKIDEFKGANTAQLQALVAKYK